ncbi:MAG: GTPase HflX [Lachnospiraceae bacterium]
MIDLRKETEKVILVGVNLSRQPEEDTRDSLKELEDLAAAAGAQTVGKLIQTREQIHPGTYVGKGKLEELKDLLWETEGTGIICDDELSPAQMKNLQDELDVKVMDRTLVILDIFAARASTSEGKLQVELAQLKYRQTRLTGFGTAMSRLGGGIGTRGPGEKKLEVDRRLIKSRIAALNRELKDVKRHREITREQRNRSYTPVAAIAGYTNAGKSTLLNTLTGAGILAEDKLFATLDPTTRNLILPGGQELLLTDTVGFISKLPHHLIDAFRSTLEEAKYADFILHVVDVSNPRMDSQMYTVYETLDNLGIKDKPVITVFNKQDKAAGLQIIRDFRADYTVSLSAKTGEGVPELLKLLEAVLRERKVAIEELYPYADMSKLQMIRRFGELEEEEYREDGVFVRAYVPADLYERVRVSRGDSPNNPLYALEKVE